MNGHSQRHGAAPADAVEVAIVGAGFSGLGMAIRLRQAGIEDFVVLERGEDVGGTWLYNSYPGCQCDIPSHLYSFSFALNPEWSRTYSTQPEIWRYLRRCAEEHGVVPHLRLGNELRGAAWDEGERVWRLKTSGGELRARFLVMAPGGLHEPRLPDIPGAERFEGAAFHSAEWDHDQELAGRRVAVIGTGASAIQIVPKIQPEVSRLVLFQRTPAWVVPHTDRPVSRFEQRLYRALPFTQRAVRGAIYWLREALVPGPELRRKLMPSYEIGCKRILLSSDYYPSLAQPNVEVVTDGVREIRERSIVDAAGVEHEVDTIVFGTGFHVTDMPFAKLVRGRKGALLDKVWDGSPQAYLGTTVAGFPNLFTMIGPNTGLGHNSIVFMAEAQIAYVLDCLRTVAREGAETVEVRADVQEAYNRELQSELRDTVWTAGGCSSWYIDAEGRCTTIWPDFTWRFRRRTRRFDAESYVLGNGVPAASGPKASSARATH